MIYAAAFSRTQAANACIVLLNSGDQRLNGTSTCTNDAFPVPLPNDGTYRIQVFANNTQAMNYYLILDRLSPASPGAEALAYGTYRTGTINLIGSRDLYSFPAGKDERIHIRLQDTNAGDPCLRVYDPNGAPIGSTSTCPKVFEEVVSANGVYTASVFESGDNSQASYGLFFDRFYPRSPAATEVRYNVPIDGELTAAVEQKQYYFYGEPRGQLRITLSTTQGPGSVCMVLSDTRGNRINGTSTCSTSFTGELQQEGYYVLRIFESGVNETAHFMYTIACQGNCQAGPTVDCTIELSPPATTAPVSGFSSSFGVIAPAGCRWTAVSASPFLNITSPASGTGSGTVDFTATANPSAEARRGEIQFGSVQSFRVLQNGSSPELTRSPESLRFTWTRGRPAPDPQPIVIAAGTQRLNYTATVANGGNWLSITQPQGALPATIGVAVRPQGLANGTYRGSIAVNAPGLTTPNTFVDVVLDVNEASGPVLEVTPKSHTFYASPSGQQLALPVSMQNLTGTEVIYRASVQITGVQWLKVSSESGRVAAGDRTTLSAFADPKGLEPGSYSATLRIEAPGLASPLQIPFTLVVNAGRQSLVLSQRGMTFTAVAEGPAPPAQSLWVLNREQGNLQWTASERVVASASWLRVTPREGTVDGQSLNPPKLSVSVSQQDLAPGEYSGLIEVQAREADNSPQLVTVILRVLPRGSDPGPYVEPNGLLFATPAGAPAPPPQNVLLTNISQRKTGFNAGVLTRDDRQWLTHQVERPEIEPGQSSTVRVSVNPAGLSPGIRFGTVTILLDGGLVRTIHVTYLVTAAASPNAASTVTRRADQPCTPRQLQPAMTIYNYGLETRAGSPATIGAKVVDDCGLPVGDANVVVTLRPGGSAEQSTTVKLNSVKDGSYYESWQPPDSSAMRMLMTVVAQKQGMFGTASYDFNGATLTQVRVPTVLPGGIYPRVSPGAFVQVFGTQFLDKESAGLVAGEVRPQALQGVSVTLGGKPLPLIYVGPGQINAVVPFDVAVNTEAAMIVESDRRLSQVEKVAVMAAAPMVFPGVEGSQGAVVHASGLATADSPVRRGDLVTIYCSGLGHVDRTVDVSRAAPDNPLARSVLPFVVMMGGVNLDASDILYGGLAPGLTGVFQVNARVPALTPTGRAVPLVISVGGQSSAPVVFGVQ